METAREKLDITERKHPVSCSVQVKNIMHLQDEDISPSALMQEITNALREEELNLTLQDILDRINNDEFPEDANPN